MEKETFTKFMVFLTIFQEFMKLQACDGLNFVSM